VIVYENGRSGFLGEHSCMDGSPTLRMNEFVLASIASKKVDLNMTRTNASELPGVEELVFELNDEVQKAIKDAEARFDKLVGKHDLEVLFQSYHLPHILTCIFNHEKKGTTLHRIRRIRQGLYKDIQSVSRRNCSTDQATRIP
jgi:Choline/Carnitine o-acyltransferase